jgi:hypothetical protein
MKIKKLLNNTPNFIYSNYIDVDNSFDSKTLSRIINYKICGISIDKKYNEKNR